MRGQTIGFMAVLLFGCSAAESQPNNSNSAANPAPAWNTNLVVENQPPVAAATPAPTGAVTPGWLAGRWQMGGGACSVQETQFTFQPDGRYSLGSEQGRWSLAGSNLTIEVTRAEDGGVTAGERHTSEIAMIGADEAELRTPDVPPVRLQRCR